MSKIRYIRESTLAIDVSEISTLSRRNSNLTIIFQSGASKEYADVTEKDFFSLCAAWEIYQAKEKYKLTKYEIKELCDAAIAQATGLKLIDTPEGNAKKAELKCLVNKIRERINEATD